MNKDASTDFSDDTCRAAPVTDARAQDRGRVMVVDDEPNIVAALRYIFERDGWSVSTSNDGDGLVERLRAEACSLLILDIMLPMHSGLDLLMALRRHHDLASLPVIMLTARGSGRAREAALQAGASSFIAKPFNNAEILAAARHLMEAG